MTQRTIMHLDMNAFFASVEQADRPELRGKPVAVIGSASRTVVTTASYEARGWGVKTGMTVHQAKSCCPSLILVVGNNRRYSAVSTSIIGILRDFTPLVEVFSIDEAFLDVTGSLKLFGSAEKIAGLMKERIRSEFGLTCSIGIAPNKLLAKLASEMKKPDGLTVIPPEKVREILDPLPVRELCGVGGKLREALAVYGVRSCGDLRRLPPQLLRSRFGAIGDKLLRMARGIDDSPVVPAEEEAAARSVGHSMTLEHDLEDREEIVRRLLHLSEMVGRRARRAGAEGKTVTLSIRFADFDTFWSRQETRSTYTNLSEEIFGDAVNILDGLVLPQPVRLLGVRLSNLRHDSSQLSLFAAERSAGVAAAAMDRVNDRFGEFTLTFGTLVEKQKPQGPQVISPSWRPTGTRKFEVE